MFELFQDSTEESLKSLKPTQDVAPGFFDNAVSGTGKLIMKAAAGIPRNISLLGSVVPRAIDELVAFNMGNKGQYKQLVSTENYFKWHDEFFQRSVDYWDPKPNEVGMAGQIVGGVLPVIAQVIASPALAVANQTIETTANLTVQDPNLTPMQTIGVGALQGGSLALGVWLPATMGNTLASRVGIGVGSNVALGAATRAGSSVILGDSPTAEGFAWNDPVQLSIDAILGGAFGAAAHVIPGMRAQSTADWDRFKTWAQTLKPSEIDALTVLRLAQHKNQDSMPGVPVTPEAVQMHVDKLNAALERMMRDEPVDVSRGTSQQDIDSAQNLRDTLREQAISRVGQEAYDAGVQAHLESMGNLAPDQVEVERAIAALRIAQDADLREFGARATQTPDEIAAAEQRVREQVKAQEPFAVDPARQAAAEAQLRYLTNEAERIRVAEGLPRPPIPEAARPPADITPLDPVAQAQAVGRHIEQKLLETGMQKAEAVANAAIWEAFAKSAHDRYGITPAELMAKFGVDVRRMDSADQLLGAMEQRYEQGAATKIDTPEFKRWFGDSKVVDAQGKPLVVYHGTRGDFSVFDVNRTGTASDEGWFGKGIYLTPQADQASLYATVDPKISTDEKVQGNVMPVYVKAENPFETELNSFTPGYLDQLKAQGHDAIFRYDYTKSRDVPVEIVVFKPEQIKSSTGNRGTFDPNNPNILYQGKDQPFYSELARQIDTAKTTSAPAKGWKDTIKGLVNKGVVKQTEVEATGLNDWLDLQEGKVTKQQLQDFIAQNGVRVDDVTLGAKDKSGEWEPFKDGIRRKIGNRWTHIWELPDGTAIGQGPSKYNQKFQSVEAAKAYYDDSNASSSSLPTKFSQYQLPGGENYRELLLTLPPTINEIPQWKIIRPSGQVDSTWATQESAQIQAERRGAGFTVVQAPPQIAEGGFRSSHFDQPNILAHIRFNERTDADGKRVLFIEEFQSDWAQKGKKEGFAKPRWTPEEEARVRELEKPRPYPGLSDSERQEFAQLMEKSAFDGVPSAPFVGKTEAWVALSLKRMIRYAAENGFDRIAWTNGEQQVSRYTNALRKQVDVIEWKKTKDGVHLVGYKDSGRNADSSNEMDFTAGQRSKVVDTTEKESVLSDAIGKAMADKIKNDPNESGVIQGQDIKIDDTGMATFYDRIVPNVANEVLRKLGGEKTKFVKLDIPAEKSAAGNEFITYDFAASENGGFDVFSYDSRNVTNVKIHANVKSVEEARSKVAKLKNTFSDQSGFDITPEVASKALAGLPLFQGGARGAVSFETGKTLIALFDKADKTTFQHETGHVFLEMTKELTSMPTASIRAMQDWATISKWLKLEGGDIPREAHEQWARGWEKYLAEGKAPNNALKQAFKRFRDWIIDVYHSLAGIDSPINNQIRGVMARMLESQAKDPVDKGGLDDPRLQTAEYRDALEKMGHEAGWMEVGGSIQRDWAGWEKPGEAAQGEVIGRSKWIPYAEWYARMQATAANMPGVGGGGVRRAVQKAVMGEKMSAAEKSTVTWMLDEHMVELKRWEDSGAKAANPDGDPYEAAVIRADEGIESTPENILNMALVDRAIELDPRAVEAIPDNFDDAQFMARVREIIDAKQPAEKIDQGSQQDEGQAQAQTEYVAQRPAAGAASSPPPPGGTGEAAVGAADMARNEAYRFAEDNPDLKIRAGENADGTPIYKSLNDYLEEAAMQTELANQDAALFQVAAECLLGVS